MGSRAKKKLRVLEDTDKISKLSDDVIHRILSFVDAKEAVQTSVLSKRWKLVWTTLPFLNIGRYEHSSPDNTNGFIRHVLSNRNHQSHISELKLCSSKCKPSDSMVEKFVEYAIDHNAQDLNLELVYPHAPLVEKFVEYAMEHNVQGLNLELVYRHAPFKLSILSSKLLKKLTLRVKLADFSSEPDCWDLPALTSLHLIAPRGIVTSSSVEFSHDDSFLKLPGSCLTCLPALRTLCLDGWDLSISSFACNLPNLTTLRLSWCKFTRWCPKVWDFPALVSLELDNVNFPKYIISRMFSSLVSLQNLTLILRRSFLEQHHCISCPELLNLNIKINCSDSLYGNIKVLAPKLRNFSSVGILSITLEVPELETVNIKLRYWSENMDWRYREKLYRLFTDMLSGLGNAKNLTFDSDSLKALAAADFLASLPSPFHNLKMLKLPPGYEESSMSGSLRTYLLGVPPKATIVTTLPPNKVNHPAAPVSATSQKVMLEEPFATLTNVNYVVDAHWVGQIGSPVAGTSNDLASSSGGDGNFGLWHGHEVKLEFVCLLDLIMKNYPQTFEHYTAKSERFHTMMLNMLCTSVNEFLRISMTEFNTDIITEYRDLFTDLLRWGFNIMWLVSHLNYIEQHLFLQHQLQPIDSCMDVAKNKLQELQTHCLEKMTEIQKASG